VSIDLCGWPSPTFISIHIRQSIIMPTYLFSLPMLTWYMS
jgi:hypothetical protein